MALALVLSIGVAGSYAADLVADAVAGAGFLVGGVLAARQSNGVLCLAATLGIVAIFAIRDPRRFLRPLALPFTLGAIAGVALAFAAAIAAHQGM